MSFQDLGLSPELLKAISEKGYNTPTPIQAEVIPLILAKHDIMAGSQTGTGKTAGFTLPLLHLLGENKKALRPNDRRQARALILVPTRELAAQVRENVFTYGKYQGLRSAVIYGGVNFSSQLKQLRNGVDVIVATPGRLLDHVEQRTVDLSKIEILVLDEADRMLDMGFMPDIRRILSLIPKERQSLLFSATLSDEIQSLSKSLLNSPKKVEVAKNNATAENITQEVYPVDAKRKRELLYHLITSNNLKQVLVFTRTRHGANKLSEQLDEDGIRSTAIHGNKSQAARSKALADFKRGTVRVLVATDVAARGIDISNLPYVVNYELPTCPEDYVHRIGRTGRAGKEGKAISLVSVDEFRLMRDIERLLKKSITSIVVPGYELDPSIKAESNFRGRPSFRGRSNNFQRRGQFGGGGSGGGGGGGGGQRKRWSNSKSGSFKEARSNA